MIKSAWYRLSHFIWTITLWLFYIPYLEFDSGHYMAQIILNKEWCAKCKQNLYITYGTRNKSYINCFNDLYTYFYDLLNIYWIVGFLWHIMAKNRSKFIKNRILLYDTSVLNDCITINLFFLLCLHTILPFQFVFHVYQVMFWVKKLVTVNT